MKKLLVSMLITLSLAACSINPPPATTSTTYATPASTSTTVTHSQ